MMNRKYSVEGFIDLMNNMREELDNPTISTDIIVGYPLESNDQFQNTVNLIKKIKPDITNITRFSARPYTNAKKQYGRIKTEIVKKRSKILTKICSDISKDKNLESIGRIYNVFTNEIGKHDTIVGRSENYKPVVIKENVNIGEFYRVKIVDASQTTLFGRLI
jgi:tRNA A37 methylthiotransferase MiaB